MVEPAHAVQLLRFKDRRLEAMRELLGAVNASELREPESDPNHAVGGADRHHLRPVPPTRRRGTHASVRLIVLLGVQRQRQTPKRFLGRATSSVLVQL